MNIPTNTKQFDLSLAVAGHPLTTRGCGEAKFIAHVPEAKEGSNLVVLINGNVNALPSDGKPPNISFELFLAPLGHVEGKPVFAGDILYSLENEGEFTVTANHNPRDNVSFNSCKWPSKAPVVETRMNEGTLCSTFFNGGPVHPIMEVAAWKRIANKAIERAIADGDVIPTSLFVKLAREAFNNCYQNQNISFENHAQDVVKNYLEKLS
jgi:hypothetical protein